MVFENKNCHTCLHKLDWTLEKCLDPCQKYFQSENKLSPETVTKNYNFIKKLYNTRNPTVIERRLNHKVYFDAETRQLAILFL